VIIYIYRERERGGGGSHGSGTQTLCTITGSAIREEEVETVAESTNSLQSNSNLFTDGHCR
jgi:hypothetical protein